MQASTAVSHLQVPSILIGAVEADAPIYPVFVPNFEFRMSSLQLRAVRIAFTRWMIINF